MAGTINYAFDPNQRVWVISECSLQQDSAIKEGTIIQVRAVVRSNINGGSPFLPDQYLVYDVRLDGSNSTIELQEQDIFVDVDTALQVYKLLITA